MTSMAPPKPKKLPGGQLRKDGAGNKEAYEEWLARVSQRSATGSFSSKRGKAEEKARKMTRKAEARSEYEAWLLKKSHHDRAVEVRNTHQCFVRSLSAVVQAAPAVAVPARGGRFLLRYPKPALGLLSLALWRHCSYWAPSQHSADKRWRTGPQWRLLWRQCTLALAT